MKATRFLPFLIAVLLSSSIGAFGQTSGRISGTVTDEKGAVISNATVTARSTQTNITHDRSTGED